MPNFRVLLTVTTGCMLASAISVSAQQAYIPVTDARLENPEAENWLMYRGTYDSHGYSALKQINTRNVRKLKPLWTFSTGLREGHQAPPVVNNGYMFITTPHNHILALDAATGDLLWRYIRELPEDQVQMHPTNRGVALYENLVLMATADCYVVALDATTGEVVWETEIEDYSTGYYMTLAPLVAKGKVMVGVSGGEFGIRGFIAALDAKTGQRAWKTHTIPAPGEPGSESWPGDSWKTGGVPVMVAPGWVIREPAIICMRLPFWHWTSKPVRFGAIINITGTIPGTGTRCLPPYSLTSNATGGKSQGLSIPVETATCGSLSVKTTASTSSTPAPTSDKMYSLI